MIPPPRRGRPYYDADRGELLILPPSGGGAVPYLPATRAPRGLSFAALGGGLLAWLELGKRLLDPRLGIAFLLALYALVALVAIAWPLLVVAGVLYLGHRLERRRRRRRLRAELRVQTEEIPF